MKKVAIVGAGITGLYLAWKLSERGHKVRVLEAKEEIGKKSCSGLISDRILDSIPQAKNFAENKINEAQINFPGRTTKLTFSNEFLAIDRPQLDQKLAELAQSAGAEIKLNYHAEEIPHDYDYVLGCDGPLSVVREELNLKELNYRLGIRGFINKTSESKMVETWPVTNGFIWKIPRGERTEYGIIAPNQKARRLLNKFLQKREIKLKKVAADLIGQGLAFSDNEKVALCGEAAGLTKGWSGGGVIWGLKAADLLLETFPEFDSYRKKVKRFFGSKIFITNIATNLVYKVGFNLPYLLPKHVKVDSDFLIS